MKLSTKFNINDKLYIKELKIWGKVKGLFLDGDGMQYNLRYFHEFKPLTCYFLEDELSDKEENNTVGFVK